MGTHEVGDLLAFERAHPQPGGAKEQAIRERFGCSAARYYQALLQVIDTREALECDPVTVRRLRAARERNRGIRKAPVNGW